MQGRYVSSVPHHLAPALAAGAFLLLQLVVLYRATQNSDFLKVIRVDSPTPIGSDSLTWDDTFPVDVSQRVVEHQMGTGWGDVCTGHLEPCQKAHQGGGAGQGIQLVASVVEASSF